MDRSSRIVTLAALCACVPWSAARANTLTVGGAGFSNITQALQAAQPGDEILVLAGTWLEPATLRVRKVVTLRSEEGPQATTIRVASGTGPVIEVSAEGAGSTIDGFTFSDMGGSAGAAVSIDGGSVTLRGSHFDTNTSSVRGGAVFIGQVTDALIDDCSFTGNSSTSGGALHVYGGDAVVRNSTFTGNVAEKSGGAVDVTDQGNLVIDGCFFESNQAGYAGGAVGVADGSVTIASSEFAGNEALEADSESEGGTGGAVVYTNSYGQVLGSRFVENWSYQAGSAVAVYHATVFVSNNEFVGNETDTGLPMVYYHNYALGVFRNNVSRENDTRIDGAGCVLVELAEAQIANNLFIGNHAYYGSAGAMVGSYNFGTDPGLHVAWIENNTFVANEAPSAGAAITFFFADGAVRNNIAADNHTASYSIGDEQDHWWSFTYNISFGSESVWPQEIGPYAEQWHNVSVDPGFVAYSADGDFDNDDFHLAPGSPAINAGDPDVLDPDGSLSDLGAYGGVYAAGWGGDPHDDGDGDGLNDIDGDCDDVHATALPGGTEQCDRLDNDCDGQVDEDLDCSLPESPGDDPDPWNDDDVAGDDDDASAADDTGGGGASTHCGGCTHGEPARSAKTTPALLLLGLGWARTRRARALARG